jgi:hypothetical protein
MPKLLTRVCLLRLFRMGGSVYLFFDFIFAHYSPTSIVAQSGFWIDGFIETACLVDFG